ncbi:MAG: hypothetical protein RLP15_07865 [Cryomorphaceae bacterium]
MFKKLLFPVIVAMLTVFSVSCNQCDDECSNGGTCNDSECDCLKGYSGPTCDSLDLCELRDIECAFGLCEKGDCICQEGYEGELCEVETRAKFLGTYQISEYCDPLDTVQGHYMEINRNLLNPTRIELSNVFNANQFPVVGFFSKVNASVQKSTVKFSVFSQNPDGNDRSVSGSGVIDMADTNNITVTIDYTVVNGNKTYTCRLEGVKQ